MSKVVTIPTSQSPFVVMVNGAKYVFPAGSVQEVPDEVAIVIEAYSRETPAKPVDAPFDCCEGGGTGGSSVQSDWNQNDSSAADFIKNKPFGDSPTGGDTLYWDGNTEGLVCFLDVYYKVSDATPSMGDFANGFVLSGAQQVPEFLTALGDGAFIHADGLFVVVPEDNMEINGEVIPSKGVYFLSNPGGGVVVSYLTIPGYTGFPTTKKIEEKYLPGAVILYEDGTYLYNTEDVSDASNRTSYAKFKGALQNGIPIYLCVAGFMYALATQLVLDDGFGVIVINEGERYTAEYVP